MWLFMVKIITINWIACAVTLCTLLLDWKPMIFWYSNTMSIENCIHCVLELLSLRKVIDAIDLHNDSSAITTTNKRKNEEKQTHAKWYTNNWTEMTHDQMIRLCLCTCWCALCTWYSLFMFHIWPITKKNYNLFCVLLILFKLQLNPARTIDWFCTEPNSICVFIVRFNR